MNTAVSRMACSRRCLSALQYTRASSSFIVVDTIQNSLVQLHDAGVPWWAVFGNCTVAFRLLLFPLVRQQIVESSVLKNAIPEINTLTMMYKNKLSAIQSNSLPEQDQENDNGAKVHSDQENDNGAKVHSRSELTLVYLKAVRAALTVHDISLLRMFTPIALNFSLFVSFVYSIRSFIIEHSIQKMEPMNSALEFGSIDTVRTGLETGGFFWFENLTQCDPTYVLPCMSIGLSYLGISIAFNNTDTPSTRTSQNIQNTVNTVQVSSLPGPMVVIREGILTCLLLSIPFISTLPAGVFMYWLPNSIFSISQTLILRNPTVRKVLNI